jgi:hypothetical protein
MKYEPPKFLDDDVIVPPLKPREGRESEVEKYLVARAKALGGEVRKVKWLGRVGAPDRLVMLPPRQADAHEGRPGAGRTIWVELKRPGKLATFPKGAHEEAQDREHDRMRKMGQYVAVIDSKAGVDEVLS